MHFVLQLVSHTTRMFSSQNNFFCAFGKLFHIPNSNKGSYFVHLEILGNCEITLHATARHAQEFHYVPYVKVDGCALASTSDCQARQHSQDVAYNSLHALIYHSLFFSPLCFALLCSVQVLPRPTFNLSLAQSLYWEKSYKYCSCYQEFVLLGFQKRNVSFT